VPVYPAFFVPFAHNPRAPALVIDIGIRRIIGMADSTDHPAQAAEGAEGAEDAAQAADAAAGSDTYPYFIHDGGMWMKDKGAGYSLNLSGSMESASIFETRRSMSCATVLIAMLTRSSKMGRTPPESQNMPDLSSG
jgi:hypothetical protein